MKQYFCQKNFENQKWGKEIWVVKVQETKISRIYFERQKLE